MVPRQHGDAFANKGLIPTVNHAQVCCDRAPVILLRAQGRHGVSDEAAETYTAQ